MGLSVLSLLGLIALGGGLVAGASLFVAVALAGLTAIGLVNGIRLLGELLEGFEDPRGPDGD
jgi:hypothetical protein